MSISSGDDGESTALSECTKKRVSKIYRRSTTPTPEEELARKLVPKLAGRSYHLPGYTYRQDWLQYMLNNHPLLGMCCHHKLHPLKKRQRLVILLGSFAFGVAVTNLIYLWFLGSGRDHKQNVFEVNFSMQQNNSQGFHVSSGFLMLVTVGSGSNTLFDHFVWSVSACKCCRSGGCFESRGRCPNLGSYFVTFVVVFVVAFATCIAVLRASTDEESESVPLFQNRTDWNKTKEDLEEILDFNEFSMEDYSFLKGYALEFGVSLFFWWPVFETILFTGVLGCFFFPVVGGRPYAIRQEEKANKKSAVSRSVCPTELA